MGLTPTFRPTLWLLAALALALRWPYPAPAWLHFDETSFIVLPLGFWGGDLNPHFFNYPTFHFYLVSAVYLLYYAGGWLLGIFGSMPAFVADRYLVDGADLLALTRGLNSVMSALTVAAVGFLGRRLGGARLGLLAAAFLAVMPLSARFAHLANTDTPAVLWVTLALLAAARARQEDRTRDAVATGVFVGLAAATKYPAALVAVPVAVSWLVGPGRIGRRRALWAVAAAAVTVVAATPFVFLDPSGFWQDFGRMSQSHLLSDRESSALGALGATTRYAVGWLGLPALAAGLVAGGWRSGWAPAMVLAGLVAFVAPLLAAESTFMRYALPLAPMLALLLAAAVCSLHDRRAWLGLAAVPLLAAEPLHATLATRSLLSGDDTREQAIGWVLKQAPDGGHLVEPPSPCGRVPLLTPQEVFVHQAHFLRSYDEADLLAAYRHLAGRADLPPLFVGRQPLPAGAAVSARVEPRLSLRYHHPVCPPAAGEAPPPAATFAPGAAEAAGYDGQDWYFLPTVGFRHVNLTGPRIEAARLPVAGAASVPPVSTAEFYRGLAWILEAGRAAAGGRPQEALQLYGRLQAAWPAPEAVLGAEAAARLLTGIGMVHLESGRPHEAVAPLERAARLMPADLETRNTLGAAAASAGRLARAAEVWKELLADEPGHAPARRNLVRALEALGRTQEARRYRERREQ